MKLDRGTIGNRVWRQTAARYRLAQSPTLWEDCQQAALGAVVAIGLDPFAPEEGVDLKIAFRRANVAVDSTLRELVHNYKLPPVIGRRQHAGKAWQALCSRELRHRSYHQIAAEVGYATPAGAQAAIRRLTGEEPEDCRVAGARGTEARWPGWQKRRARAREMRFAGATLEEIRVACGYRSIAAVHYACAGIGRYVDQCSEKVRYCSAAEAVLAASQHSDKMESYSCPWCDHWHIGHQQKQKKEKSCQ